MDRWAAADLLRPEVPAGTISHPPSRPGELASRPATTPTLADEALAAERHRDRTAALAQLAPRERRELVLHAAGYRYQEIAELTGSSYTAVNRRITEGRARLRRRTRDAANPG